MAMVKTSSRCCEHLARTNEPETKPQILKKSLVSYYNKKAIIETAVCFNNGAYTFPAYTSRTVNVGQVTETIGK